MMMRAVFAPSAPSQLKENDACPPWCRHGWKWSLTKTESKPTVSARQEKSSNSPGPNCSADALSQASARVLSLFSTDACGATLSPRWHVFNAVLAACRRRLCASPREEDATAAAHTSAERKPAGGEHASYKRRRSSPSAEDGVHQGVGLGAKDDARDDGTCCGIAQLG